MNGEGEGKGKDEGKSRRGLGRGQCRRTQAIQSANLNLSLPGGPIVKEDSDVVRRSLGRSTGRNHQVHVSVAINVRVGHPVRRDVIEDGRRGEGLAPVVREELDSLA